MDHSIQEELNYTALQIIQEREYRGKAQNLEQEILIRVFSLALLCALRYNHDHTDSNPYREAQSILMSKEVGLRRREVRKYIKYIKKRYDDVIKSVKNDDKIPADLRNLVEIKSINNE